MEKNAKAILTDALDLPEGDRAEIAGALLESLEPASEAEVEEAWRREVAARVAALDAGEVETSPWEEIRDELISRLSERRERKAHEESSGRHPAGVSTRAHTVR